jgi:Zn-dependent protease
MVVGVGAMLLGARQLRPRPVEMEEFLTGRSARPRPAIVEVAGPIAGVIGVVAGIIIAVGGLLYVALAVL